MYQAAESSYQPGQHEQQQQHQFGDIAASGNEAQVQLANFNSVENDSDGYSNGQSVASSSVCDVSAYLQAYTVYKGTRLFFSRLK